MKYKIIPTHEFIKNIKSLKKRYKNIKNDVLELATELEENPTMRIELGNNTFYSKSDKKNILDLELKTLINSILKMDIV